MNSRRLVFIGILALALGAVVSTLVYHQLQAKTAPAKATVDVVVAAKDIQVGAKIAEQDLKIVKYLPDDLPSDFFRAMSSVVGHGAVLPIDVFRSGGKTSVKFDSISGTVVPLNCVAMGESS